MFQPVADLDSQAYESWGVQGVCQRSCRDRFAPSLAKIQEVLVFYWAIDCGSDTEKHVQTRFILV